MTFHRDAYSVVIGMLILAAMIGALLLVVNQIK